MDVTGMLPVERQYWGKISINREHIHRKRLVKKSLVHGFLFEELPEEAEESGKVDGATEWQPAGCQHCSGLLPVLFL